MRFAFILTTGIALVLAGCAAPEETVSGPDADGLETREQQSDLPQNGPACVDPTAGPAGYDSTGSTQPGQVGTGTGDIGAPTSCPADEQPNDTRGAMEMN